MTSWACWARHEFSDGTIEGGSRSTASRPRHVRGPRSMARVHAPVLGDARSASVDATLSVLLPDRTSLPFLRRHALLCLHVGGRHGRCRPALPAGTAALRRHSAGNGRARGRPRHGPHVGAAPPLPSIAPADNL